ncbi:MAG: pyridoxamine 5'-phosphate oxidase family protein [Anaerolineae bacterium]|nr:pyridoxamine 5'-phosphate oxidase family protein [Anaerolineae bacterium]
MINLNSQDVWQEIEKQLFAVLGIVTAKGEARTVGVVYVVHGRTLLISSQKSAWKVRHISQNPHVSLTVPIHKRIPIMPWVKIPAATITFSGEATVLTPADLPATAFQPLFRGLEQDRDVMANTAVIQVKPAGEFITYGVGVSLIEMRQPDKARGRVAVDVG